MKSGYWLFRNFERFQHVKNASCHGSYNGDCYGISELLVGLRVGYGDYEGLGKSLKSGTFPRGQLSRIFRLTLIDENFAPVLIVSCADCACVGRVRIEKRESETVSLFQMFPFSPQVPLVQFVANRIFLIDRGFQNIAQPRFCLGGNGVFETEAVGQSEPAFVEPYNVYPFTVLRYPEIRRP